MVSRENRVLLVAAAVGLSLLVVVTLTGVGDDATALGLLAFVVVSVLLPQLYLAATSDSVAPRTRIRVGVLVTVLLTASAHSTATPAERPIVAGALVALVGGLLVYEVVSGYRESVGT
jgi:hypothetical protein